MRAGGQTNMTKLIVDFSNFANAPKKPIAEISPLHEIFVNVTSCKDEISVRGFYMCSYVYICIFFSFLKYTA